MRAIDESMKCDEPPAGPAIVEDLTRLCADIRTTMTTLLGRLAEAGIRYVPKDPPAPKGSKAAAGRRKQGRWVGLPKGNPRAT
jgi:hypothetical protein